MSNSLWPHGLQHARLPCPSPTPRACSKSCPLSWWCHPTISSSVVPFSCLQSFPVLRIRWPKYGSFSFSISPSSEYSGLISGTKIGFPSPFSMLHWLAMFQMVDTPPACVPHWGWWGYVKLNICHVESCDLGALCYNSWPVGKAVVTLLRWKKI